MDDQKLLWDSYNTLLLSSDTSRIRKILARYELFKIVEGVPGDIIECGVFKGAGFMYWLKLLDIYSKYEQKRVVGFDTFDDFAPENLLPYEAESASKFVAEANFNGVDHLNLIANAKKADLHNCELVKGDVIETIPEYVRKNPGFRISLLNLDFDTYAATKVALSEFYKMVSPGGIIVFDEYGKRGWGESDAVDEFLEIHKLKLHAIRHTFQPTAYVIKN